MKHTREEIELWKTQHANAKLLLFDVRNRMQAMQSGYNRSKREYTLQKQLVARLGRTIERAENKLKEGEKNNA